MHSKHLDCTLRTLGPLACSDLELTSETMNLFRQFGRTSRTVDRPSESLYLYRTV